MRDEALTGEPAGQPLSRESFKSVEGADGVSVAEGNAERCDSASVFSAMRGLRPWHVGTLLRENWEISCLAASDAVERSASGRRGVEADEEQAGEVRPFHSSEEASEQTGYRRGGPLG